MFPHSLKVKHSKVSSCIMGVDVQVTCRHSNLSPWSMQGFALIMGSLTRKRVNSRSLPQYSLFLKHTANSSRNPVVSQLVLLVESPAPQQKKRPDNSSPYYDLSPLVHSYPPWGLKDAKFFTETRGSVLRGRKRDHCGGAKKNHSSSAKPHWPAQVCHCDACCSDTELGEENI